MVQRQSYGARLEIEGPLVQASQETLYCVTEQDILPSS